MSVRTMARVWEHSRHTGTALLMMLAIADFSDDDGNAYPAVATLARKCRMSSRNANLILAALKKSGELVIRANEGPKGTNLYRIPKLPPEVRFTPEAHFTLKRASSTPEAGFPKPLKPTSDKPSLNRQEPSVTCAVAPHDGEPEGFADCWNSYPKREGGNSRQEAMKAFKARVRQGALPADLLAGVKRYAAFIRAKEQEGTSFVKQAASFFGPGEHWKEAWAVEAPAKSEAWAEGLL